MKNYVQYHNTNAQGGRPTGGDDRFQIFANKSIKHLVGSTVWLISGEGASPKRYFLEYVFLVEGVTPGSPSSAWGTQGQRFDPPIPLNELPWFGAFKKSQQNFSLGVRELAEAAVNAFKALLPPALDAAPVSSLYERLAQLSAGDYLQALRAVQGRLTEAQVEMLVGHANAPGHALSMAQIAACGGYEGFQTGNSQYGRLGGLVAEALGVSGIEQKTQALAVEASEADELGHWQWAMRPALFEALRQLWPDDVLQAPQLLSQLPGFNEESLRPTERAALVKARVGQGRYRKGLLALWGGRCALTGLDIEPALVASHAKPWTDCANNAERLDPYNGLLLAASIDRLFDRGLISFEDDGRLLVAATVTDQHLHLLGLGRDMRLNGLHPRHISYLQEHRKLVFGR